MNNPEKPINETQILKLHIALHADNVKLPYFDYLLAQLKEGNEAVEKSFSRHVHWGYGEQRELAVLTTADFEQATENLSRQVCLAGNIENGLSMLDVGCGFGGTVAHINEHETAALELLSRLRLVNYYIYGFKKQG